MLFFFYLNSALWGACLYITNANDSPLHLFEGIVVVIGAILEVIFTLVILLCLAHWSDASRDPLAATIRDNFWTIYAAQWAHVGVVSLWCNRNLRGAIGRGLSQVLKQFSKLA
jgi:hypothetical protein